MPPAVTQDIIRKRAQAAMSGSPCGRILADAVGARKAARISNTISANTVDFSSLGKRKKYPVGYGADVAVPQEQSLARKKKRTLWDGGLSQISAIDLAPPGTPPKQLSGPLPSIPPQDNSFFTPPPQTPPRQPGNPPLTPIKYYSPSVASPETPPRRSNASPGAPPTPIPTGALPCQPVDSTSASSAFPEHDWPKDVPLPVLCGHPIHPAYADSYNNVHCPVCIIETAMNDLKSAQEFILRQGGMSTWKENLIKMKAYNMYNLLAVGGKKHKNVDGTDVSWKHHMTLVSNLISELRSLSKMEQQWEAKQTSPITTNITFERTRLRKQWSATSILRQYKDGIGNRFLGRMEKDAQFFSRKRGRDWEIVADPAYPDYPPGIEDVKEDERFVNLTDEQKGFVINSSVPQPKETDVPDLPPKRKRRRGGAGISFNPNVYVRTDADVDILRKQHISLSEDFLEDKPAPKKPGPSILRTAPLKIDPTPSRPHTVIPLHPRDGRPRGPREGHMYRHKRGYKLGQWATGEGMERVNTSGHYLDFQVHLDNGVKLQQEAAVLDNDEKFAELTAPLADTEMDDAPVGDTPEATPAPEPIPISQQESEPADAVPVPSLKGKMVRAGVYGLFGLCTFLGVFG